MLCAYGYMIWMCVYICIYIYTYTHAYMYIRVYISALRIDSREQQLLL